MMLAHLARSVLIRQRCERPLAELLDEGIGAGGRSALGAHRLL